MLNGNDVAKLSADDLWVFHQKVVELLVARIKKRSRELDELLPQLGLGHKRGESAGVSCLRPSGSSIGGRPAKSASQLIASELH